MSDAAVDLCPECGQPAERLLSAGGGLIFKGSGFYITDYRGDSYKKAAEADSGKSAIAAEGKSDSAKPDSAKSDSTKSDSTKSDSVKSGSSKTDTSQADKPSSAPSKSDSKPSGGKSTSD